MNSKNSTLLAGLIAAVLIIGGIFLFAMNDDDASESTVTPTVTATPAPTAEPTSVEEEASQNIVELAQGTEALSTLVAAVVEADLVDTLSGEGPFTVFAPTDDAFAALLADLGVTAEELLAREDLGAILTYHVVAAEAFSGDLTDGQVLTTVQGGELVVSVSDAGVTITDVNGNISTVVTADVDASNGVVHVVDTVVLP